MPDAGVLTLVEEASYQERDLCQMIREALGHEQDATKCDEALEALKKVTFSRAELTSRWTSAPTETDSNLDDASDDPDDPIEDPAPSTADRIPLLRVVGRGDQWKVKGIVGSGMLEDIGLAFEVLPKIRLDAGENSEEDARRALIRMWEVAEGRPSIHEPIANVADGHAPTLHEWLIERFLDQLDVLLARGIRLQYVEREDNLTAARGKLLPRQNLMHNRFAPHRFYCRFDELSIDRPENRLIRAALDRVARSTAEPGSKRRAKSLVERLHEVPPSVRIGPDFAAWRDDRLMAHYRDIRFTCRWILNEEAPAPAHGRQRMFGCFVRASSLFEGYVTEWIRQRFAKLPAFAGYELTAQSSKQFCWPDPRRAGSRAEVMRPDMVVSRKIHNIDQVIGVLDAKWKQSSATDSMSRADLYQMISYATFWMQNTAAQPAGPRRLALIYPSTADGHQPARSFRFPPPMQDVRLSMHWFRLPRLSAAGKWEEGLELAELFEIERKHKVA